MMHILAVLMIAGLMKECDGVFIINSRNDELPKTLQTFELDEYCYSQDPNPYHLVASKTSYTFARDHNITHSTLVPEGCSAKQLWHLIRHGTRYPSHSDIDNFLSYLPDLQAQIIEAHQSGQGEMCVDDISLLADWDIGSLNESLSYKLAEAGVLELHNLASRYRAALPSLLHHPFSNQSYTFRHTATERTKASAQAYAEGIFGAAPVYLPPALDPDPLLKFYDVCPKYVKEVDENPEAVKERTLFIQGEEMATVVASMSQRLGLHLDYGVVEVLYDACRFYQAWSPDLPSAWCAVFTHDDLKVLEYSEDLDHYYTAGYGHLINYQMACPPLKDVFNHFRSIVEGKRDPRGVFYFTHSKALLTVMSRLGLYYDSQPLTHNILDPERQWRTSRHGPFASNLAFTLSSCPSNKWWVSVVEGGQLVNVSGCESTLGCTWDEFVDLFMPFQDCDLASICRIDQENSDSHDETSFLASTPRVVRHFARWVISVFNCFLGDN